MINFLSIVAIGFFLGMRHATDPDHVIAVTTIVSQQRSTARAAMIGAFWGLGHTVTIFVVGTAIILFNVVIPIRLGLGMEFSVGLMLILLGVWTVASSFRAVPVLVVHSHTHRHGDIEHAHTHTHADQAPISGLDRKLARSGTYQGLRPLMIGIVHGLAGSAAVALLILATIRNPTWAIIYLLVFGIGTIAGMMVITMSIASTFRLVGNRYQRFSQNLGMASGLISLAFGLFLAYQIGIVQGLFTSHPQWTPH